MKKRTLLLLFALTAALTFASCGKEEAEEAPAADSPEPVIQVVSEDNAPVIEEEVVEEEEAS